MTDVAPPVKAPRPRGWLLVAGFVAVDFILGAAVGVYASGLLGQDTPPSDRTVEEAEVAADPGTRVELEIGRITVVIPANHAEGGRLHLLITPLVVGHSLGDGVVVGHGDQEEGTSGPVPELRDAFIEYLSQLHEPEVRGSLGLVTMRAELLRRARAVAPELNASAVLIQEYVIQ